MKEMTIDRGVKGLKMEKEEECREIEMQTMLLRMGVQGGGQIGTFTINLPYHLKKFNISYSIN